MKRLIDPSNVFEDDFGQPLSGGRVHFYTSGTATRRNTYSDVGLTVLNPNPMPLGSDGRLLSDVYATGTFTVTSIDRLGSPIRSLDNISSTYDAAEITFLPSTRTVGDKLGDFYHVADYGAFGPDSTAAENLAGIIAACGAIQTNGGGTLLFDPITYAIYGAGTVGGTTIMKTFSGLNGVTIDGRGATLNVQDTFAGSELLVFFQFINCKHIDVGHFNYVSIPEISTEITVRGIEPILCQQTCENVHYHDITQIGGVYGWNTDRTVASQDETYKSRNITIERWVGRDVGYPISCQNSGDFLKVSQFKVTRPGRAVAIYGLRNFDIDIEVVDPISSPSCYLTHGVTANSNYLENGRLRVTSTATESNSTQANTAAIYMVYDTVAAVAGVVRNIEIELNCEDVAGSPNYVFFSIGKVINGVGADTTDRGHLIENVKISGSIRGADNRGGVVDLCYSYGTWGSGDTIRNLSIEDLSITGSATTRINVDLDPIADYLMLTNVHAPSAIQVQGSAQYGIQFKNCNMGVMQGDEIRYSIQTLTGSGAIDVIHLYTYLDTTGGGAYTLPDGREGQHKVIVLSVDAGDATITPASFIGNPSATITMGDEGDLIDLLFTSNGWVVYSNSGCAVA